MELLHLYGETGLWDKAESVLNQILRIPASEYNNLARLAIFLERHGKWNLAEKFYLEGAAKVPARETAPLMDLGAFYARRHAYDKALQTMQKALEIRKNDPTILVNIARVYLDIKKIDEAESAVDKALKNNPEHVQANYVRGRIYFQKKDFAKALERFNLTIMKAPRNAEAYYYKALCLLRKGARGMRDQDLFQVAAGYADDTGAWERKLAEENLQKALELNPKLMKARLRLAEIHLKAKKYNLARQQIEATLEIEPHHLKALTLLGALKISQGDMKEAENIIKKVLARNPDLVDWHVRLGVIYASMQRLTDALQIFQKVLETDPLQIDALKLIVAIYLRTKKFDEAFRFLHKHKKIIAGNRTGAALIEHLEGAIFMAQGESQKASLHFQKAIAGDPKIIPPRMALAGIYARNKKTAQAIAQYEAVLGLNAEYLPACMALGMIHDREGQKQKAEKYYRQVLEINSGYGPAANNLAVILAARDDQVNEALRLAWIALEKMPNDANAKETLGWIYYRKGNYDNSITEIEESLALMPTNAIAKYHLGLAYYSKKEFEKARALLKEALKLNPNFEGARHARSMLDE